MRSIEHVQVSNRRMANPALTYSDTFPSQRSIMSLQDMLTRFLSEVMQCQICAQRYSQYQNSECMGCATNRWDIKEMLHGKGVRLADRISATHKAFLLLNTKQYSDRHTVIDEGTQEFVNL